MRSLRARLASAPTIWRLIDDDGFLFLHGRADDAINRGGFKILPDEVAAVLRRYPGVRDAAVVGKPDARLGQVPIAAIEMAPGTTRRRRRQLEAFAREHLTAYMIPKEFHFVDALPRTASMKVSRPELKQDHRAVAVLNEDRP